MSDSESEWFDKDDEELLKDLQITIKKNHGNQTEHITGPTTKEEFLKQLYKYKSSATCSTGTASKQRIINIKELRKLSTMNSLEVFLFAQTYGQQLDFFHNQITINDNQERIQLYIQALAVMCEMELPGFHKMILKCFSENEVLLEQLRYIMAKLFSKYFPEMWQDVKKIEHFLQNVQMLLLGSCTYGLLDKNGVELMQYIMRLLEGCENPVVQRLCVDLKENLRLALAVKDKQDDYKNMEIYPSLEDLSTPTPTQQNIIPAEGTTVEYFIKNLQFLKEHFLHPLRSCVQLLKEAADLKQLTEKYSLYENVYIILNEKYLNAQRHELTFVDVYGVSRHAEDTKDSEFVALRNKLAKLKIGSLLCFSTSKQFENVLYAIVTYTATECLQEGYVGIEVVQQYNIGNIYNCPLLMLESPNFFEPYNNVYNYLRNCNLAAFPLKKYIVNRLINAPCPSAYLKADALYTCGEEKFHPLTETPPAQKLNLNDCQLHAYSTALRREFTLIQGPPGTGKTHVSVQLVKTLIENAPHTPIVLITFTNDSLDRFLLKLAQYTERIVRFGGQSRTPELMKFNANDIPDRGQVNVELKKLYSMINNEYKMKFQELQNKHKTYDGTQDTYKMVLKAQQEVNAVREKLQTLKMMFQFYMVREMSVIAMTTTYAAKNNFLLRLLKSSIVIFEEAAEILECHVVACLTPYTQHVIMIGDHEQLKPFTSNSCIGQGHEMNCSLFEKLFQLQQEPLILKTQYRMHPCIAQLLVPTIYKELSSHSLVWQYPNIKKMLTNLYFVQHKCKEEQSEDDTSLYNPYEVKEILRLTQHLVINAGCRTQDLVILSPYIKQIEHFKRQLDKYSNLREIKACTVDSFQGLEANIVILSLVRCNTSNQIGFLRESNRICVALSRAKWALYIIGDLELLSKCSIVWHRIAEKLKAQKAIGTEFPIIKGRTDANAVPRSETNL